MSITAEIPRSRAIARRDDVFIQLARGRASARPVRRALVRRVRAEIAAGTYDTARKLDIAIDRLLRDLFPPPRRRVTPSRARRRTPARRESRRRRA